MKKNFFQNPLKIRSPKLALACMLPLVFVMCRNYEKRVERNRLDNEISQVKQEIRTNKNLHTVRVPQKLRDTQIRYNNATDSVNKNADTMDWCMNQNDSLLIRAYNNYAERVGRDFQMSVFLPDSDIAVYQKYVSQLNSFDSVDMTIEHARRRILNNTASLNDVSLFFEYMPDSINHELRNPLGWNFYMDTTNNDTLEMSVYEFTDSVLFCEFSVPLQFTLTSNCPGIPESLLPYRDWHHQEWNISAWRQPTQSQVRAGHHQGKLSGHATDLP